MTPKKVFSYYYGIHLHFLSESYSVLKYGPDTERARNKYNGLSEARRFKFIWMNDKFQTVQNVVYALLASELADLDAAYCSKQEILDTYYSFKSRRESISHVLKNETERYECENPDVPGLLFSGKYCPEFILLKDHTEQFLNRYFTDSDYSFAKAKILKLIKYKNFFPVNKHLPTINHENTVSA